MIEWFSNIAYAMDGKPQDQGGGSAFGLLFPILLIVILYYFMIHLPQRKKQQERTKMLDSLARGDEIMTTGGIYGRVSGISDKTVTVEIAPKVKIKIAKAHIVQVTAKAEAQQESKQEE